MLFGGSATDAAPHADNMATKGAPASQQMNKFVPSAVSATSTGAYSPIPAQNIGFDTLSYS